MEISKKDKDVKFKEDKVFYFLNPSNWKKYNFDDLLVVQHNSLARWMYELWVLEFQMILYCIAKFRLEHFQVFEDREWNKEFHVVKYIEIDPNEFGKFFWISKTNLKFQMEELANSILNAKVFLRKTVYWEDLVVNNLINWFSEFKWTNWSRTTIRMMFNSRIVPYLLDLKSNFCMYKLEKVKDLKSKHSYRFYQILNSWAWSWKTPSYTIEWFKKKIWISENDEYFSDYRRIKEKIIKKALKEINEKTNLEANVVEKTSWRKVTNISFNVKDKHSNTIYTKSQLKEMRKANIIQTFSWFELTEKEVYVFAQKIFSEFNSETKKKLEEKFKKDFWRNFYNEKEFFQFLKKEIEKSTIDWETYAEYFDEFFHKNWYGWKYWTWRLKRKNKINPNL